MPTSSPPLRVLYIARAPFVSGAERALMSMLRHLDRSRVQPHLALGCESDLVSLARAIDVPVTMLPLPQRSMKTLLPWWRCCRRLAKLIRAFQPAILHANDVPSCQAMSVVGDQLHVPRVIHVRWVIEAKAAAWWARRGAESLLCISRWMKDQLGDAASTSLSASRLEVLPDCVDWPATTSETISAPSPVAPSASQELPRQEPVASKGSPAITLGYTGQLIESKGLDLVIAAMGKLPADKRPMLLVAGEDTQTGGQYLAQLKALAEQGGVADRIEWFGFLKDVSELHRRVDAMVCPSRVEPLGLVPLEAARLNVPAIACNVGGLAESIVSGETGLLVEPTADAWAAQLAALPDRATLRRFGTAARQRTIEHYSPMVYQRRLMAIYDQLLA